MILQGKPDRYGNPALCAARYSARVVDLLKGGEAAVIEFYAAPTLTLSEEYLVFLSRDEKKNDMMSTNSMSMAVQKEFDEACEGVVAAGLKSNEFAMSKFYQAYDSHEPADWVTPGWITFPEGEFPERHEIDLTVEKYDRVAPPPSPERGYNPYYQRFPIPFTVWGFDGGVKWTEYREHILSSSKGEDGLVYPEGLGRPNLVNYDPKTGKLIPKRRAVDHDDDQ